MIIKKHIVFLAFFYKKKTVNKKIMINKNKYLKDFVALKHIFFFFFFALHRQFQLSIVSFKFSPPL